MVMAMMAMLWGRLMGVFLGKAIMGRYLERIPVVGEVVEVEEVGSTMMMILRALWRVKCRAIRNQTLRVQKCSTWAMPWRLEAQSNRQIQNQPRRQKIPRSPLKKTQHHLQRYPHPPPPHLPLLQQIPTPNPNQLLSQLQPPQRL
jgi:hypothetical protein